MNMNTYCYKIVGQTQFQLKEEKICGTKHCTLKRRFYHHCKNYTSLQLHFILKSTSSLLIRRYTLVFTYFNPHDWFDLMLKDFNVNEFKDITTKRHLTDFYSFFTEIAEICEQKTVIHTSNYLGEGTLTWGQEKQFLGLPTNISDYYIYQHIRQKIEFCHGISFQRSKS